MDSSISELVRGTKTGRIQGCGVSVNRRATKALDDGFVGASDFNARYRTDPLNRFQYLVLWRLL